MGFYIRKSVSVGPLRFNLSRAGIGVSAGIKGFRIGSGPNGNYIHMGRGGIYFRQTLPSQGHGNHPPASASVPSGVDFTEIESGSVNEMVDSSSTALLEEINAKAKKSQIWPWILIISLSLVAWFVAHESPIGIYLLLVPPCVAVLLMAIHADKLRKTVVLLYELEPDVENAYRNLHSAFGSLKQCSQMWHIESEGRVTNPYDWKVNAGASGIVRRESITPDIGSPPYFQCNLPIPVLPAGKQRLYFLPDRILVWDMGGVGAISYAQLSANSRQQRFIEDGNVPSDAKIVGSTWRYVNKKGGPDGRFRDNRELPIALYDEILLKSASGLQEAFQVSKLDLGVQFVTSLGEMSAAVEGNQSEQEPMDHSADLRFLEQERRRNAALEQRKAAAAAKKTADEQVEFFSRLTKTTCYYRNNDEQVGPVSLWQVHELIDAGVLPADVPVIVSGTDFWRSYPEVEFRYHPSPKAQQLAGIARKSAEMQCYFFSDGKVCGPQSLVTIFQLIHSSQLPPDVQICAAGTEKWVSAQDIIS